MKISITKCDGIDCPVNSNCIRFSKKNKSTEFFANTPGKWKSNKEFSCDVFLSEQTLKSVLDIFEN